eukprot:4668165-Prymnesium_polylepis.2
MVMSAVTCSIRSAAFKSASTQRPSACRKTLSDLMSRWRSPRSCMCTTAAAQSAAMPSLAARAILRPEACSTAKSVPWPISGSTSA